MKRQPNFTKQQLIDRIKSIADYTKLARQMWGTKSIGYQMQVDMLKVLARRYRECFPTIHATYTAFVFKQK